VQVTKAIPVIEVFDLILDEQIKVIGFGYIEYHLVRRFDDISIVFEKERPSTEAVNTRIRCCATRH
jgi:hypothetical protein